MREIKFRAWNGEKMIYRGLSDRNWYSEDKGGKLVCVAHPNDKRELSIMQFTGLQDNQDVEIYEGDILKYDHEDGIVTARVIFKHSDREDMTLSGFEMELIKVEEYENENPVEFTVVGNIYQNPELLDPR